MANSQYIVPPRTASNDTKLGWFKEVVEDGETYIKGSPSWKDIDLGVDIIAGQDMMKVPKKESDVHINMIKRDVKEAVATLSNMRLLGEFKTDNNDFNQHGEVLNKMQRAWFVNTYAAIAVKEALQYAAVACLGWLSPIWEKDFWVVGRGDVALRTYGPRDVLPYQIGKDHNIQKAYVVTFRDEMPLFEALAKFPLHADLIGPDHFKATWLTKGVKRVTKFLSPVLNRFGPGQGKEKEETSFPTVDIFRSYVLDLSVNMGPLPLEMGEAGTNWAYTVPVYKSDLPTGIKTKGGQELVRKATLEDAMIYPLRRLVIWTTRGIINDDSSPWWHGKVPGIPLRLDSWPWDYLGGSMTAETASIQSAATRLVRGIDNSANCRLDPALQYDQSQISESLMENLNFKKPGQRIKVNMQMGDGIKTILDPAYYDVPSFIPEFVNGLYEKMHHVLGTRDIQAIAKAKQIPAGDSLEKMMELAGPIITDQSRDLERAMQHLGEMWKGLAFQFYTLPRRVQVLGKEGVTEEDFDYHPGNMIPSHMPDEMEGIRKGEIDKETPSRFDIVKRARAHQNSFIFHIAPNSLHQITQLTRKLLLLQLWRGQFPIDPWSVAEAMDLENYGNPDSIGKILGKEEGKVVEVPADRFGRWLAWTELKNKLTPQPAQKGRHPSGQQSPTIQGKDGGTRSTVRESPR